MTLQKPIGSGFNSKTNANKITCDIDLSGKTAIVTGGYSGIGLETSRELVLAGANVIIPAKRKDAAAKNLDGIVSKENIIEINNRKIINLHLNISNSIIGCNYFI